MSEIIEEFFQGYCRAYDMARTAVGEFRLEDKKLVLDQIDCDYGTCIHGENCQMMKQVFAFMEQENEKRREQNMLKIRDIREEDREIFFEMAKDFYGGPACDHEIPQKHFEDTLRECLRSREYSRTLILEDETGVAGYFLLAITWSNEAGGMVIWLDELYFKPEYRGKGYGTQAFAWVEKEYPDAKRFRLEATYSNDRAISLYRKLGYEELNYYQMIKDR